MPFTTKRVLGPPSLNHDYCSRRRWKQASPTRPADANAMEIAAYVHDRVERWIRSEASRVVRAVEGYGALDSVSLDELASTIHSQMEMALLAFAEQSPLSEADLEACRDLGRRRAEQGVPLPQLLRGFRLGYRALWEEFARFAGRSGASSSQTLLERSAYLWKAFDQAVSTVEEAYRGAAETTELDRTRTAHALLVGLHDYPRNAEQTLGHARSLGVDPHGWFAVAVSSAGSYRQPVEPTMVLVEQPDQFVIIMNWSTDALSAEAAFGQLLERQGFSRIGVGIVRRGLAGAQQAFFDAESAHRLALALGEDSVRYRENWLSCIVLRHRRQLDDLVAPAIKVLKREPELSRTLEAFLAADGNLTATGKVLFVHPNTVGYRLKQFAERTGIDPRRTPGIGLVQVALVYLRLDSHDSPEL